MIAEGSAVIARLATADEAVETICAEDPESAAEDPDGTTEAAAALVAPGAASNALAAAAARHVGRRRTRMRRPSRI